MSDEAMKADLVRYLQGMREALLWKLDGLDEYDLRRPMTRTATNLLGLVKHTATAESRYLGGVMGRPFPEPTPWDEEDAEANEDLWATPEQTRDWVADFYRRVWAHSDATVAALPLDAPGTVPWWPEGRRGVTLHEVLVHVLGETARHAGHADIVRENVDGAIGLRPATSNLPDDIDWPAYYERVDAVARSFR